MSALPIVIPEISAVPEISATQTHWSPRTAVRSSDVRPASLTATTSTSGSWKLTDRGIAVIMLLAAVILTTALAVIGITALRVSGADYNAGSQASQQAQR
jgi:hypothetical protein